MQWLADGWQRQKRRKRLVASTEKKTKVKKQILSDMPRIISQIILLGARELIVQPKLVHSNSFITDHPDFPRNSPQTIQVQYILLTSLEISE